MAGLIPQTFIDDLLDRIDIVDVVDARVKLKKTGKNYSACCPFHEEKTPSFTVSPDKQFYYCFGCGASGTALGFVLEHDRLNFPDAVEELAKMVGLEVPREARDDSPRQQERKNLYQLLEKADQFFRQQLRHSPARQHAINYLQQRGLSGEIARDFGIGYAPPGWDNLLKAIGLTDEDKHLLAEGGMLIERPEDGRRYDRFRNRIMFPIRDTRGRVIGFGGRVLGDDKPKYLNSPETPVFHKGRELYGLFEARQAYRQLPRLLVVEGYMDVVALAQFGIRYGVATLGTACGEDHLALAFKYTQEVVFCFDGDEAGRNAARRALENSLSSMQDGRQVKFLFLPDGEDPDTLVRQVGTDKFTAMIDLAVPLEDFLFDSVADGIDIQSMEGRARLSKRSAPLLHKLPAGVFRELMFANLAQRTGLPIDTLMELVDAPAERPAPPLQPKEYPGHPSSQRGHDLSAPHDEPPAVTPAAQGRHTPTPPVHRAFPDANDYGFDLGPDDDNAPPPHEEPGYYATPTQSLTPKPAMGYRGPIKLPPSKLLCALILQHPELVPTTPDTPNIQKSEDRDLKLYLELLQFLRQRPSYSLPRVLGHWRGTKGAEATDELAKLATVELLNDARQRGAYNAQQEYLDCLTRLESHLAKQKQKQTLEKLSAKNFNELSESEKQQIRELHTNPAPNRT
ncbi:DNA primase [Aestuariicella hydrocarbonica]|uniref:DNA primase n=1 Tax=Pseudomaricurvus hydrocarbonicus TaxID=1470433 RepID=A0A9E5T4M5_9GAMM|nr:DNA primase [Aestuariicella hydrocarbonica]NHO68132.1 DNA primase [Aestuariicella hydrocarbonica]